MDDIQPIPDSRIVATPAGEIELPLRFVRLRVGVTDKGAIGGQVVAIAAEQYCAGGCGLLLATALRQWKPGAIDPEDGQVAKGEPVMADLGPRTCAACHLRDQLAASR